MQLSAPTVESLSASFPKKDFDIPAITGEPDRISLDLLINDIRQNAASVRSIKGGGTYGHLAMTMAPAEYLALPGATAFTYTASPGELTFTVADDTTIKREDARDIYNRAHHNFELELNVKIALRNILLSKLEESTYITLRDDILLYNNVTVWEILHHLLDTYGDKTTEMLSTNVDNMKATYDCSQPSLEQLFVRQDRYQKFAADTPQAITDGYWILFTYNIIDSSGLLNKSCQKWDAELTAYKTKAQFRKDFTKYHKSYIKKRTSDSGSGQPTAYNVELLSLRNELEQQTATIEAQTVTINGLVNIANSAADASTIDNSVPPSITLPTVLAATSTKAAELTAIRAQLAALLATQAQQDTGKKSRNTGGNGKRGPNDKRLTRPDDARTVKKYSNTNVCHTHGYDVDNDHTSTTCKWPDKHHNYTATKADPKGACALYKRLNP